MSEQKSFDPFAETPRYTKEQCLQIFGPNSDGRVAQRLRVENRSLYDAIRADAVKHNILAPVERLTPNPQPGRRLFSPADSAGYKPQAPERRFSDREVYLRSRYSEQEVRGFFQGTLENSRTFNPGALSKGNPEKYRELVEAGISYGILADRPARPAPMQEQQQAEPERFTLSDDIARKANLPLGHRVTVSEFENILENIRTAEAEREQAAREKLAAESARIASEQDPDSNG